MLIDCGRKARAPWFMSEADYAGLITAAYKATACPGHPHRDNLKIHISAPMRTFTDAHRDWLTVVRLPPTPPISTRPKAYGRT